MRYRTVILIALLATLCLAVGCGKPSRPNLILISIDTLRADHLGCYGSKHETSPRIDRLAQEGLLFEHAIAPTAWTLPSHASMLTGLNPGRHGAQRSDTRIDENVEMLAERLSAEGYRTAAVVNAPFVQAKFGFDRGFESYDYIPKKEVERHQQQVMKRLQQTGDAPFFHFYHYMSVHDPYTPEDEFNRFLSEYEQPITVDGNQMLKLWRALDAGERTLNRDEVRFLNDLYRGGVLSVDHRIGLLLEALEASGKVADTIVVLTSDHGEEFMEHGSIVHTKTLYDESLHVPLIMRGPGIPESTRVSSLAGLIDIVPTVLGLLGLPVESGLDGVDLAKDWLNVSTHAGDRELAIETSWIDGTRAKRGIRTRQQKLIVNLDSGESEFYDLHEDPAERNNLYPTAEALVLERRVLQAPQAVEEGDVVLSPEDIEQLKSLGYID